MKDQSRESVWKFVTLFLSLVGCTLVASQLYAESLVKEGLPENISPVINAEQPYPRFTELVKELSPAVVNISVEAGVEDELTDQAVPAPNPFQKKDPGSMFRSLGSGFIVHEDGFVVTNNHVIDKSEKIIVRLLDDKTEYPATVIGRDLKTDLALLKIKPLEKLHTVYFGNSDDLQVGEWVIAIGNQFQLGHTVSAGIVSALSRRVRMGSPYDAYIQTDASINPGSSGGPLFNTKGQVIGINTAIFSPGRSGNTGFNIGIGFAIPINLAKSIVFQLKEKGKVTRGLLGVIIQGIDSEIAQVLKLSQPDGALVADIIPGSPAETAGFQRKDVIVSFQGKKVKDYDDLPLMVANTSIGSQVQIDVLRGGEIQKLTATIQELKDQPAKQEVEVPRPDSIGAIVGPVTPEIAKTLGMKTPSGVMIKSIEPSSPAAKAGLDRGDVIEEIDGRAVIDVSSFEKILTTLQKGKSVLVLVRKSEGTRFTVLKPK